MLSKQYLFEQAEKIADKIRELRQRIHQYPELAYRETLTSRLVNEQLEALGIPYENKTQIAKTGVIGIIQGSAASGPQITVALRADMDALQKTEKKICPYSSKINGCMHACGHDGHTAILLGAAEILVRLRDRFSGTVKLIFQPGEEGGAGGQAMVQEGVLHNPSVDWIFALHGWPNLPCGAIGIREGTMMVAASAFVLEIIGRSAHAASPHRSIDPVIAAATIITTLQNIRSRLAPPTQSSVVSITIVESGNRPLDAGLPGSYQVLPNQSNIIPEMVRLTGTSRALTEENQIWQLGQIKRISENIAQAFGAQVEFRVIESYPPTINDPQATQIIAEVGEELLGKDNVHWLPQPSMGGEDFSYYLQENVRGSYFRLGLSQEGCVCPCLHSDCFDFNDSALVPGMAMMAGLALKILQDPQ